MYRCIYDGVKHQGQHFFAYSKAVRSLGLSLTTDDCFVRLPSNAKDAPVDIAWPEDVSADEPVTRPAFAYSSFHTGAFLVAVNVPGLAEGRSMCWVILEVQLEEVAEVIFSDPLTGQATQLRKTGDERSLVFAGLRPHQPLEATVAWQKFDGGVSLRLNRLQTTWSPIQKKLFLERPFQQDGGGPSGDLPRPSLLARAEACLAGRTDAFDGVKGRCSVEDALVVLRRKWMSPPRTLKLSFLVVCKFPEEPGKVWTCKVQQHSCPGDSSILWTLQQDTRVRGTMYEEWQQVDCIRQHVLDVEKVVPPEDASSVFELVGEDGVETRKDIFEGGSKHWTSVWRREDLRGNAKDGCYWKERRIELPGLNEIIEIAECEEDVASLVRMTFLRLGMPMGSKIKAEHLRDLQKEEQRKTTASGKVDFGDDINPYAKACEILSSKVSVGDPATKPPPKPPKEAEGEHNQGSWKRKAEDWRGGWSASREWGGETEGGWGSQGQWKNSWRGWQTKKPPRADEHRQPPRPPPPPPLAAPPKKRFSHFPGKLQHSLGEAAASPDLEQLRNLRYALETMGVGRTGEDCDLEASTKEFERHATELVWDCLPHLGDDPRFAELMDVHLAALLPPDLIQKCRITRCSREEVNTVFSGFVPAPVYLGSFPQLFPIGRESIARLACATAWMSILEKPPSWKLMTLFISELPPSLRNRYWPDASGRRTCLVKESDLALLAMAETESRLANMVVFTDFVNSARDLATHYLANDDHWEARARHSACSWAVHFMETKNLSPNLRDLFGLLKELDQVSLSYRMAASTLHMKCIDTLGRLGMKRPDDFELKKHPSFTMPGVEVEAVQPPPQIPL